MNLKRKTRSMTALIIKLFSFPEKLKAISVAPKIFERHDLFKDYIKKRFMTLKRDPHMQRKMEMKQTEIRSLFAK